MTTTIAIAEDEPDLREVLVEYLTDAGFHVIAAGDGPDLRAAVAGRRVDLAVLDIVLPGEDGLSLARWLRQQGPVGIIMATAQGRPIDRIVGLELGADDYVVKPYELRELLARIRSVLRRTSPLGQTVGAAGPVVAQVVVARPVADGGGLAEAPGVGGPPTAAAGNGTAAPGPTFGAPDGTRRFGDWTLDSDRRLLSHATLGPVTLTPAEFDLLAVLAARAGRIVSRQQLIDLTGGQSPDSARAIDVRIARLRRRIEPDPDAPQVIRTVRGQGYVFWPQGSAPA